MYNKSIGTKNKVNKMLTIQRVNCLGFVNWQVVCDGVYIICTFDRYVDAVEFIRTMEDLENA